LRERAKEGRELRGLLCRRPPFGPDFHQQPGRLTAATDERRGAAGGGDGRVREIGGRRDRRSADGGGPCCEA
jgi:hypothetical protein